MNMKNIFCHLKVVLIHKFWVMYYCFISGLYYRGIVHDMSKFSLVEFCESVKFFTGVDSPIKKAIEKNGYSKAWLHHAGHNSHHHSYWNTWTDNGLYIIRMPFEDAVEMICDCLAASRSYKRPGYKKQILWWKKVEKEYVNMHPDIKNFCRMCWEIISQEDSPRLLSDKKFLHHLYNINCTNPKTILLIPKEKMMKNEYV